MRVILIVGILLILGGILFPLFTYFREVKKDKEIVSKNSKKKSTKTNSETNIKDKVDKDTNVKDSRDLLDFEEILICNEDEAILKVAKDEYVAYLEVSGVSYNLLSIEEKLSLEESYGTLLNGVDFEFQQFIQSRSLKLDSYVDMYQDRINSLEDKYSKLKQKLETINDEKEIEKIKIDIEKLNDQLSYAYKLLQYFRNEYIDSSLLERKYYVILKYFHDSTEYNDLSDLEILKSAYSNLYNKASIFTDSFQRMNINCKFLNGFEMAELLYSSYNKDESNILKLNNAIKAKYNHLCTTATPIFAKQILEEKKKIEEEQKQLEESIKDKVAALENLGEGM